MTDPTQPGPLITWDDARTKRLGGRKMTIVGLDFDRSAGPRDTWQTIRPADIDSGAASQRIIARVQAASFAAQRERVAPLGQQRRASDRRLQDLKRAEVEKAQRRAFSDYPVPNAMIWAATWAGVLLLLYGAIKGL